MRLQMRVMIEVLARYLSRIDRIGDDPRAVVIRHHYVFALMWNTRYREASAMQQETSLMADRLGDSRSKAYALAGEIIVSTIFAPKPLSEFEILKRDAITGGFRHRRRLHSKLDSVGDWLGRDASRTHERCPRSARELMQVGRLLNDPRSTGFGLEFVKLDCNCRQIPTLRRCSKAINHCRSQSLNGIVSRRHSQRETP